MIRFRIPPVASTRLRFGPAFAAALLALVAVAEAAEEKATPARLVPAKGLTVLVEYDGVGDRAEAWKATAAYAVLNATPAGETLASVVRQVADRLLKDWPEVKISSADLAGHYEHVFRHGFLFAVYDEGNGRMPTVAVLNGFGSKDARARTDRLIEILTADEGLPKPVTFRGREMFQIKMPTKPLPENNDPNQPPVAIEPVPAPVASAPIVGPASVAPAPSAYASGALPAPVLGPASVAPAPIFVSDPVASAPVVMPDPVVKEKEEDGPKPVMTWWFEGDDLIITDGLPLGVEADAKAKPAEKKANATDRVSAVLDAIEGKTPSAATHPGREAALAEGRGIDGFGPNGLVVIESAGGGALLQDLMEQVNIPGIPAIAIPELVQAPPSDEEPAPQAVDAKKDEPKEEVDELKALGLDRLKRVVGRWGFQGKALMTVVRFEIPAPRTGMLSLLDQPGLRTDRLPIPRDAGAFVLGSFDLGKSYDTFVGLLKTLDPTSAGAVDETLGEITKAVRDATGQRLREDLLGHLGPAWSLYTTRCEIWESAPTPVPALLVEVRDIEAFGKALDALVGQANDTLRGPKDADAKEKKEADEPPALLLERLPAPERGYRLISPEGVVPWLRAEIQPTVLLGKSSLVVAMNPELARAAVAAESRQADRWAPGDELAKTLAGLPAGVTSLSVGDVRDSSWPEAMATLPMIVQYLGNLLGASDEAAAEPTPSSAVLSMLGVPAPGGFRIKIDPAKVPRASQIRALLFPSVLATTVDDRGIRFIGAEALPFACLGSKAVTDKATKGNFKIGLNQLLNR